MNHPTFGTEFLAMEAPALRGSYGEGKKYWQWVTVTDSFGNEIVIWDLQQ